MWEASPTPIDRHPPSCSRFHRVHTLGMAQVRKGRLQEFADWADRKYGLTNSCYTSVPCDRILKGHRDPGQISCHFGFPGRFVLGHELLHSQAAKRNQFDYASRRLELRPVRFTSSKCPVCFQRSGDATSGTKECPEVPSVGATDAPKPVPLNCTGR